MMIVFSPRLFQPRADAASGFGIGRRMAMASAQTVGARMPPAVAVRPSRDAIPGSRELRLTTDRLLVLHSHRQDHPSRIR